jgi:hypothetical protein
MFKWYAVATVCYVFLEDVEGSDIAEYRDLPLEMEMTLEQEAQIQQSLFALVDTRVDSARVNRPIQLDLF